VPLAAAISGKATRLLGVPQGSAAEQAQEMVPEGVTVVSALHTVAGHALTDLEHELDEDVLICGDARDPKRAVADIIERIPGLRPVNAGALETARLVEALTPLLISVNVRNKTTAGIRLTGLDEPRW
jgi:8-hydroxy-5-deazaflavin:NADPH oxidoreductase